jgi:hypothetical protein
MNITLEEARKAFAQWWLDYIAAPESFSKDPDLEGKDSAELFFEYIQRGRSK